MNKIFCVNCGHKNIYETSVPKFCAGCGQQVGVISSASTNEKEEESHTPTIRATKLDVDIEDSYRLKWDDIVREERGGRHPSSTNETRRK